VKRLKLSLSLRYVTLTAAIALSLLLALVLLTNFGPFDVLIVPFFLAIFLAAIGLHDVLQTKRSILRNYPIWGHARFIMEDLRPKIRQYFFEGEKDGRPFPRDKRSLAYQRAKGQLDKRPFGTEYDVYDTRYEWISHSLAPSKVSGHDFRVLIGGPACQQPYSASVLNISAMSFGALSSNAILALNRGAKMGNFYHDTGEGGLSPYHRENGGDIVWEIGSGYFGCRHPDGAFSPDRFAETAKLDQIKMIEVKLSQGAKPGHGGVLPAAKITPEIASIRGIPLGRDCVSPASHPAFSTPIGLLEFIRDLRMLSGGKPVGFKLCIGMAHEFLAIIKAMLETGILPDFIVVDGKEGGTGAAPSEFIDHLGMPLREGLTFVHYALIGANLRDKIKVGCSGMVISAFDIARVMALGADWVNMARGFMFAIGCIQSQSCHTDMCPVGVATQDKNRQRALVVPDKATRVRQFHDKTLEALSEVVAGAGLLHPSDFKPFHFHKRVSQSQVTTFTHLYPPLRSGELLSGTRDVRYRIPWDMARSDTYAATAPTI
jgi:glutamate synthase domain-containing protein 2